MNVVHIQNDVLEQKVTTSDGVWECEYHRLWHEARTKLKQQNAMLRSMSEEVESLKLSISQSDELRTHLEDAERAQAAALKQVACSFTLRPPHVHRAGWRCRIHFIL